MTREERRSLARATRQPDHGRQNVDARRQCLFCLGPLSNGSAVCSQKSDDGWWGIVPTMDGEIYEPS